MNPTEILAWSRAFERPLITSLCGMSIYLGYRLFRLGILDAQEGTIASYGWKVNLEKVGPGVFFALFGAIGLTVSILRNVKIDMSDGNGRPTASVSSLTSADTQLVRSEIRALNAAIDYKDTNCDALRGDPDRANVFLRLARQNLLETVFSKEDLQNWETNKELFRQGRVD
jgi:hypothetical protein